MNYILRYTSREQQIVKAWAEWINTYEWSAFCTFTTSNQLSSYRARNKMEKMGAYLRNLYSYNFKMFWVAELHACKSNYHVHALIKIDSPNVDVKDSIAKAWHIVCPPSGYKQHYLVHVHDYEPSKGGHYYISKHLQKDNVDYDLCV